MCVVEKTGKQLIHVIGHLTLSMHLPLNQPSEHRYLMLLTESCLQQVESLGSERLQEVLKEKTEEPTEAADHDGLGMKLEEQLQ